MNTNENNLDLDQLFSRARESEPVLVDHYISAGVLNGLAKATPVELKGKPRSSLLMDVLTAGLGVAAVSYFVDIQQAYAFAISFVPESLVVSPMTLAVAAFSMSALSVASWWVIEQR